MVFPFKIKTRRSGLGEYQILREGFYLSFPVGTHDLQRLNPVEGRASRSGDQANLRLAPRRDFRMTRQIGVDMGVNDAIGIVLQYLKFVHDAIKTSWLHFGLHKRVFSALGAEWINIAPLGQR